LQQGCLQSLVAALLLLPTRRLPRLRLQQKQQQQQKLG
jgi:hypothetical protein